MGVCNGQTDFALTLTILWPEKEQRMNDSGISLIRTPMEQKKVSLLVRCPQVEMHARVVLGVGKGVLFREVSSFQEYPL